MSALAVTALVFTFGVIIGAVYSLYTKQKWMQEIIETDHRTMQVMQTTQNMMINTLGNHTQRLDLMQAPQPPRQGPPVPVELIRSTKYGDTI